MAKHHRQKKPFAPTDFPATEKPFPITEVFGYQRELRTSTAQSAFNDRFCPFSNSACEKFRQYGYGYCSVQYRTDWDEKQEVYAVCDHRLDGGPVNEAVRDFFGASPKKEILIVPEVVLQKPRQSFDFVAFEKDGDRFIAIETQAIDLRGGGVGPAWKAILEGNPKSWRTRFSAEAKNKGRKDTVAYGVNTANIYKRLGLQVAQKGALMQQVGAKLYVVCQRRPFEYLESRIQVPWAKEGDEWDIAFVTFDYTGKVKANGMLDFQHHSTYRVSVRDFAKGLISPTATISKESFLKAIRKKARLLLK